MVKTRNRSDNVTERGTLQNRDQGTARQPLRTVPLFGIPGYACFDDLGFRVEEADVLRTPLAPAYVICE
jgi:hypothetical protein